MKNIETQNTAANPVYFDPLLDVGFKKIFGTDDNLDLIMALLNAVFRGRKKIVKLQFTKTEQPGKVKTEAKAVFDLACVGEDNEVFIVEVQHSSPVNFKKRSIYYSSKLIAQQGQRGETKDWNYNITEVYLVALLEQKSEIAIPGTHIHDICLCNRDTKEIFYEGLGYIFIDFSNFDKGWDQCC